MQDHSPHVSLQPASRFCTRVPGFPQGRLMGTAWPLCGISFCCVLHSAAPTACTTIGVLCARSVCVCVCLHCLCAFVADSAPPDKLHSRAEAGRRHGRAAKDVIRPIHTWSSSPRQKGSAEEGGQATAGP